jgi:hypothetical protein
MIRLRPCVGLLVLLAAGCAAAPEIADEATPPVGVASTPPAVANAGPASSSADGVLVVDVNELAAATPPPLICRQMLQQNSNVIITRCLTEENWKRFYRQEALEAQEIVRMLQGSKYR